MPYPEIIGMLCTTILILVASTIRQVWRRKGAERLVLTVVGRSIKALHKRGCNRKRAVEIVAPELQRELRGRKFDKKAGGRCE